MQGLFRNVIGPWAKRTGRAAHGWASGAGGKGFSTIKSNAGFGWAALKATGPQRMMGTDQLLNMWDVAEGLTRENYRTVGTELGGMARRWAGGAGFMTPRMQGAARMYRRGAAGAVGGIGAQRAADFLNPWGLGFGD
jgi:hypothetical protein